jgi:hypothetical protein
MYSRITIERLVEISCKPEVLISYSLWTDSRESHFLLIEKRTARS